MKILLNSLFFSLTGIIGTSAHGAWASGGALVYHDANNPWFLENTKEVRYCIDLDETQFGFSAHKASIEVGQALQDWKAAFEQTPDDYYSPGELEPFGQVRVGTQTFVEVPCSDQSEIDLRFQLGRLAPEQVSYMDDLSRIIGIAVRTQYDPVTMRARGFIYLSPVAGPLTSKRPWIHPHAWQAHDNLSFKIVLRHELGHVFGIGHRANSLMDEHLPEMLIDRVFLEELPPLGTEYLKNRVHPSSLLGIQGKWIVESCIPEKNPVLRPSFFNKIYDPHACGRVTFDGNRLVVEYRLNQNNVYDTVALGTINRRSSSLRPSVRVYLPAGQLVFTKMPVEALKINRLYGEEAPSTQNWSGSLEISATGQQLPLKISANTEDVETSIVENGEFRDGIISLSRD